MKKTTKLLAGLVAILLFAFAAGCGSAPATPAASAPARSEDKSGTEVRVVRGTETTSYRVPR